MTTRESAVCATERPREMGSRPEAGGSPSHEVGFGRAAGAGGMRR